MDKELDKNWAIWWLLERFYGFRNAGHSEIGFMVRLFDHTPGQPNHELQIQALEELRKANVLSVERTNDDNSPRGQYFKDYKIIPLDPEFTSWYQKYKKAMELPGDLFKYLPAGSELKNDPPLSVKEELKDEYVIFYNQKGLEFFQGLGRYTRALAQSKVARNLLDKHLRSDKPIKYWPDDSYGTGDVVALFYLVYLAFYGKISNREDLVFLGFNLYGAALHEVAVYNEPNKHAPIFKITDEKFRRYLRELHSYIIPQLETVKEQKEAQYKFPFPLDKDTPWHKIVTRFITGTNVIIQAPGCPEHQTTYKKMGFGKGKGKIKVTWQLLLRLAVSEGEVDKSTLASMERDEVKQLKSRKKLLALDLKNYFGLKTDPFEDTAKGGTYRIKLVLIPPKKSRLNLEVANEESEDELGIKEAWEDMERDYY